MSGAVNTRNIVHKASLLSKFKGAFVGAVVGDCLGAYFEGEWHVKVQGVINFFENLKTWKKKEHAKEGRGFISYAYITEIENTSQRLCLTKADLCCSSP